MSAGVSAISGVNGQTLSSRAGSDGKADLVARAKAGDGEAFGELFEQHKKRVYSLCLLMTGDTAEAEDLTQDAFIQVFRKLATFRGDSAFSTWLYRVAVNTVLMSLRKRKPGQVSLEEPVRVEDSMVPRDFGRHDPELTGTVERIALLRAMEELPEGYRRIFILHEVEGYQHHEIAAMLRCSVGNSKSQLHKAKLRIRELLMLQKDGGPQTEGDYDQVPEIATTLQPETPEQGAEVYPISLGREIYGGLSFQEQEG
ncbi:MAG TPA: sigma-70 family RNA polymerase sigma factor [Terriglobales bacterium]|jgi:RNA polymerase sigma-70 factor (ECF subfamily)